MMIPRGLNLYLQFLCPVSGRGLTAWDEKGGVLSADGQALSILRSLSWDRLGQVVGQYHLPQMSPSAESRQRDSKW